MPLFGIGSFASSMLCGLLRKSVNEALSGMRSSKMSAQLTLVVQVVEAVGVDVALNVAHEVVRFVVLRI